MAQAKAIKNGLGRHRRDEARKGNILNGRPGKLERGLKPDFSDNGDAEAGPRGRHQSSAWRKPNAGRGRREGGFRGAQAPRGSRARWSTGRWELAAARGKGSNAGAVCGGTNQRPMLLSWRKSASSGNQREGQTEQLAQAGGDEGSKACQRAASERKRKGESRCAGERQARRLAGRNGRRRGVRTLGQAPEPEGGSRVERIREARALNRSSI